MSETTQRPPRDNVYRAVFPGVELRSNGDGGDGPVMAGHFSVFNQWTEIDSIFEGRFLERFAPGAFKKTISENREGMRVLFQHGFDPTVGDKPLGPIRELREDKEGAYYEVPLLDAAYVRDEVLPGLEADLYGASMRFRVVVEEVNEKPKRSAHNPEGIPERTVKEAQVREFGPVTFPAYEGASAGIRSLSDEFLLARFSQDPERMRELGRFIREASGGGDPAAAEPEGEERPGEEPESSEGPEGEPPDGENEAPSQDGAEEPHADPEGRAKEPLYGVKQQPPRWWL